MALARMPTLPFFDGSIFNDLLLTVFPYFLPRRLEAEVARPWHVPMTARSRILTSCAVVFMARAPCEGAVFVTGAISASVLPFFRVHFKRERPVPFAILMVELLNENRASAGVSYSNVTVVVGIVGTI